MSETSNAPSAEQVARFEYLWPMLKSALQEMREFSKKKQDGIVSETKITLLNRLLTDIRAILEDDQSVEYLDLLSEEDLPQNSDAVLVLGQYQAALESFRNRNRDVTGWITKERLERERSRYAGYDDEEDDEEYEDEEYDGDDEDEGG